MIYTLTANPAIDYNIACDGLAANTVTRTRNAVYTSNGKGLNVSFTLDHYGVDTTILGFFAGFSGEFIVKGAEALGVPVKPVWTDGITRVNVFLNAGPDTEYNMVNAGAAINEANEQEMFELIDSLDDMTCLVISGSLPPNTSEGFLAEVLRRVKAKGAEFVLDISSHQLADLIAMEPLLIKPNDDELLDIFGIKVSGGDDESVKGAMAELHAKGAKNVLLTLVAPVRTSPTASTSGLPIAPSTSSCCRRCARRFLARCLPVRVARRSQARRGCPPSSMATGANVVECPGLGLCQGGRIQEAHRSSSGLQPANR
ncbi:MAG: 1-phosphofructokinase family hexose kinase [Collinsella sp.]